MGWRWLWTCQHLLLPQQSSVVLQAAESPTTSDMEMRVCADKVRVNEDTY